MPTIECAEALKGRDFFLAQFEKAEGGFAANGRGWLYPIRQKAISRFAELGFPTARNEQWRHTSLAPLEKTVFQPAEAVSPDAEAAGRIHDLLFDAPEIVQLVFVNGRYVPELSTPARAPRGVRVSTLLEAMSREDPLVRAHLARHASYDTHPFVALNTAFMRDGAYVSISDGVRLPAPIHLLFVQSSPGAAAVFHPRNLILVGRDAQAQIIETYVGLAEDVYFTNAATELVVGEDSAVDHCKTQRESPNAFHLGTIQASQSRGSRYTSHAVSLGGALARNDINSALAGEGAECQLNGLYLAEGRQHLDTHTRLEHVACHCSSRELYKGILDDQAAGVFNGCIYVHPDAQKTDALQSNKCILLSDGATINTQPQLEIFADDVKCMHGASIGRLDEEGVFYMRSRGVSESEARALLIYAFANEVAGWIPFAPLRDRLERVIWARYSARG